MNNDRDGLIRVEIDGGHYNIRSGNNGPEHIKMLADFVNSMMRQVRQKAGNVSRDNVAIMAALNISERMHDERKRYSRTVKDLITELEDVLSDELAAEPGIEIDEDS